MTAVTPSLWIAVPNKCWPPTHRRVVEHVADFVKRVIPTALGLHPTLAGDFLGPTQVVVHRRNIDLPAHFGRNAVEVAQLLRVLIDQ